MKYKCTWKTLIKIINDINKNYNNSHTHINLYKYIIEDTTINSFQLNSISIYKIRICRDLNHPDEKYKYEVSILLYSLI